MREEPSRDTVKNKNKIIDITLSDRAAGVGNLPASWRNNLQRILQSTLSSDKGNSNVNIFDTKDFSSEMSSLNVNPNIYLLMDTAGPKLNVQNETEKPLADMLGNVQKNLESLSGGSGVGALLANVAGHAGDIFNTFTAIKGAMEGNQGTTNVFDPWFTSFPTWDSIKSSHGFEFTYKFEFVMGQYGLWNAKKEVIVPILNLLAPTLPRNLGITSQAGPFPSTMQLLTNVITDSFAGGVDLSTIWEQGLDEFAAALQNVLLNQSYSYTYDIKFGNFFTFNKCYITDAQTNFSTETDQYGYPVAGDITLTFNGIIPIALTQNREEIKAIRFGGI